MLKYILVLVVSLGFIAPASIAIACDTDADCNTCEACIGSVCTSRAFLNFEASNDGVSCWTAPTDFLGGSGEGNCTQANNGNINCQCKGDLVDFIEDTLPPNVTGQDCFNPPYNKDKCGAIIGDLNDDCCIAGFNGDLVVEPTHSLANPSGRVNFQCSYNANRANGD